MKHTLEIEENAAEQPTTNKRWQKVQICLNVLNHITVIAVVVYMTYVCYNAEYQPITKHTWLCTIGVSIHFGDIFESNFFLNIRNQHFHKYKKV